jgi:transcriptional regulator with XRE-family HTH domain
MSLATKIKEFLTEQLLEKNLSRRELAKGADIPYTTISRIMKAGTESGREFNPEIETILKLADYFNCTTDKVIKREVLKKY